MHSQIEKLILVSPKKSGTHLLKVFLENLNFTYKGKLNICSHKKGFYSLGYTFHTSYNKFFYLLDRDSFDGGKLLPLNDCLGIVSCRHPLDILFSHLNFSYKNNNTAYSNIPKLSMEELIRIFFENQIYEDFFKSLYEYTFWSYMNNFITLSYEHLIDIYLNQKRVSYSLKKFSELVKIKKINEAIFKSYGKSDTFHKGIVGKGLEYIKKNNKGILENKYYGKYCDFYGYDSEKVSKPKKLDEINKKEILLFDSRKKNQAYTVEFNFSKHTIIYYNKKLYAIPDEQNIDFMKYLKFKKIFYESETLDEIKFKILNYGYLKKIIFKYIKLLN